MRIGDIISAASLAILASALFPFNASAAGSADNVALRYHFAGAADLAGNTNFDQAKGIFSLLPARRYEDLVLDRLAGVYWRALQFDPGGDPSALLRPLLNDLLQAESAGSFGGRDKDRMDFVVAARLGSKSAQAWEKNLEAALRGPGQALTAEGYSGRLWNRPGSHPFWILRARDWTVAGSGDDLLPVRAQYLQNIQRNNRPAPVAKDIWLSAEINWPLLAVWAPLSDCPLKLARTKVEVTASSGRLRTTAHVLYPEAAAWHAEPWHIPKGLVSGPLSSFTAGRDLAAYLNPDRTMSRLSSNPLTNQLYCWAMQEMVLESFAACPVADATQTLRKLGQEAPAILNPFLEERDHTQLAWQPKEGRLAWNHLALTSPTVEAVHEKDGDFLLARVFPMGTGHTPVSEQLWRQIEGRHDLVYYDWELTGLRLMQWRLLTEMMPVLPPPTPADAARRQKAAQNAKPAVMANEPQTPQAITEAWLAELSSPFLGNTVTEATRTSPTELTVARNSEFLFTGLELAALSHWLADAPVGPIDYSLLPVAKMSGPLVH